LSQRNVGSFLSPPPPPPLSFDVTLSEFPFCEVTSFAPPLYRSRVTIFFFVFFFPSLFSGLPRLDPPKFRLFPTSHVNVYFFFLRRRAAPLAQPNPSAFSQLRGTLLPSDTTCDTYSLYPPPRGLTLTSFATSPPPFFHIVSG